MCLQAAASMWQPLKSRRLRVLPSAVIWRLTALQTALMCGCAGGRRGAAA
jgi:hypothetical protein